MMAVEPKMKRMCGVEIFKSGEHKGNVFTDDDLAEIASNFAMLSKGDDATFHVPMVFGHEENQQMLERTDLPAGGWVSDVWQMGDTLYCDFAEIPEFIARLIDGKSYRTVSSEIYDNFTDEDGVQWGKVLRRVAVLGGEIPEVKSLADLPVTEFGECCRKCADGGPTIIWF